MGTSYSNKLTFFIPRPSSFYNGTIHKELFAIDNIVYIEAYFWFIERRLGGTIVFVSAPEVTKLEGEPAFFYAILLCYTKFMQFSVSIVWR